VTDLRKCLLLKVKASFVHEVSRREKLQLGTILKVGFPWYARANKDLVGFKVLRALAGMSLPELGIVSPLSGLNNPIKLRSLGTGSTAHVYGATVIDVDAKNEMVLKVAVPKRDGTSNSTANERKALAHLNGAAAPTADAVFTPLLHVPWLHVSPTLHLDEQKYMLSSPVAELLVSTNVEVAYIRQLMSLLKWLHTDQVWIHRDISPHNLMLASADWRATLSASMSRVPREGHSAASMEASADEVDSEVLAAIAAAEEQGIAVFDCPQ
jgi:hypothetical protein